MIEPHGTAPYAPSSAVVAVLAAKRKNPNLKRIDAESLEELDVRGSLIPRTIQALRLLDLVDEDGFTTSQFEELIASPSMSAGLQKVLRSAYAAIFNQLDPTAASGDELEEAFEQFQPAGQRSRMVTLFTNLMKSARMIPVEAHTAASAASPRVAPTARLTKSAATGGGVRSSSTKWSIPSGQAAAPVARHTLKLSSGGAVNIALDVDLFTLSRSDREFVIDLVDRITEYRASQAGKVL